MLHNPYTLLGVEQDDDTDRIRKRYKTVSRMFHPDKHANDKSAVAVFQLIKHSYESIKSSRTRMVLPKVPETLIEQTAGGRSSKPVPGAQSSDAQVKKDPVIVPGTNLTANDIRILGEQLKDPWFHPNFNLTEMFGDVSVPEKNKKSMRPQSTRT